MKIKVKVLKFDGKTGLRKVGSDYLLDEIQAVKLESDGFVKILKEEKFEPETKELKIKLETKTRKKKK